MLNVNQHGFLNRRSTSSNILDFKKRVMQSIDNGGQFDIIFLDFCKAFDRVPHSLLLQKLVTFGFHGKLLRWFSNYWIAESNIIIDGCKFRIKANLIRGSPRIYPGTLAVLVFH